MVHCYSICLIAFITICLLYLNKIVETATTKKVVYYNDFKLDEYISRHNLIVKANNTSSPVVFCKVKNGYGNRVYSMLSALTMAVLTDSACYITWPNIENYIQTELLQFLNQVSFNETETFTTVTDAPQVLWNEDKNISILITSEIPESPTRRLWYDQERAIFFKFCSNPKYYEKLRHYGLVTESTIETALNAIQKQTEMPTRKIQDAILQVGFEVGGTLLNKFWLPNSQIQMDIDKYLNEHFHGNYVIGMQFRTDYLSEADYQIFFNCASQIEFELNQSQMNEANKPVKWFITSDNENLIKFFLTIYNNEKIIVSYSQIGHVEFNLDAYTRTIIDSELLARCDETIITAGSTYGFMSMIRAQKLSYYVEGRNFAKQCNRLSLSRPGTSPYNFATF